MNTFIPALASVLSLALCLISSLLFFLGVIEEVLYKAVFLIASAAWFILATIWAEQRKKKKQG